MSRLQLLHEPTSYFKTLCCLMQMLQQFPFRIRGFHSDNGSEFINETVEKLLNKLLVEQTKSRAAAFQRQRTDGYWELTEKNKQH